MPEGSKGVDSLFRKSGEIGKLFLNVSYPEGAVAGRQESSWTLPCVIPMWGLDTSRWVGMWPDHCPFHQLKHSCFPWKEGISVSALSLLPLYSVLTLVPCLFSCYLQHRGKVQGHHFGQEPLFSFATQLHCSCLRHPFYQKQWLNLYFAVALGQGS